MYDALDALQLNSTQWNYTASNRNDLRIGDNWNQEDLSIFSRDQQSDPADPDSGGRALAGFCRPFARHVQGRIAEVHFARDTGTFTLTYDANPAIDAPTEIYLPDAHYPDGYEVEADEAIACDGQLLRLTATTSGLTTVRIVRKDAG
jgi:hypothetical protein